MSIFIYADDKPWDGTQYLTESLELSRDDRTVIMGHRQILSVHRNLHFDPG
jgi:hypothetical protein